ncbi:hypothetical protein FMUND_14461 [Fusarium mundagurra]|uniref:Uncharacterized protein n=1 Tax=Fusarium mundagurra TaxID=1567541 RepID=A0A8H5XV53_9HYPO|nr:hypothetical protein FMUND_14461 [Fusarium mundagurra]
MPPSIPYDSSLTLMSVVNQDALRSVEAIAALQAPVDAAQDALNSLISSKRSLTMTKTELKNLGVSTDALDEELKNLNVAVEAAAGAYTTAKMAAEPKITAIRKDIHSVHKQIESPVDYLRSEIRTIALANDTMNMDVRYFSFDSNSQNSAAYSAQMASYVSGAVSSVFGTKQSMRIGNAASRQVSRQVSSHSIEGTLVLSVSCTHKNASIVAPFVLHVDKAIKVWNHLFPGSKLDPTSGPSMMKCAMNESQEGKEKFSIISGVTYGSSFVGMVHVLNTTSSSASESMEAAASQMQSTMNVGAWFAKAEVKVGVDSNFASNVKNLLSQQNIQSHVTVLSMGVIPSMVAHEVSTAVSKFNDFDPKSNMAAVAAMQNAVSTHDYVANEYETINFVAGRSRSKTVPFLRTFPAGPNARRLPAYIRIEAENKEHRSLFQGNLKEDSFVSLFALIVLGSTSDINWLRETKEITKTGDVDTVQLSKEWQGWHDILPQMGILDTISKHGGKPVNHLNISLTSPILIKPLKGRHEAMILKRFAMTPEKFFQVLIDAIHNTSDPDSLDRNRYPWQIYPDQKPKDYIMTSHDPFNFYETYIHQTDWDTYMKSLEKTGSLIRPFPRINQKLYDLCKGVMLKVGSADIALQASMKKESGKSHDSEDEDLKILKEKDPKKVPRLARPFTNLKAKARAQAEKKREKRKKSVKALNKVYEVGFGTALLWNDLDVDKIQRAAGKRPDEAGQKEIMGGVSATEIGSAMGRGSKRLKSRVFPAEVSTTLEAPQLCNVDVLLQWLHLSAFSRGVIGSDDDPEGFSTCQNFENLVFGTSETNSLMTSPETKITVTLDICCNDYNNPILWDASTSYGQFGTGVLRFKQKDLEIMKKNGFQSNKYLSVKEEKLSESYIKEQMLMLAHDFPFIVYSIQYDLQADFKSRIFCLDNMECSVLFFPFRRPFYHRAGALLDDLIFKELYAKAKAEPEVLRSNL